MNKIVIIYLFLKIFYMDIVNKISKFKRHFKVDYIDDNVQVVIIKLN